jgi:phenylpyruvate tautomerase PptA (4-oxalocrotonate tautomerase family)
MNSQPNQVPRLNRAEAGDVSTSGDDAPAAAPARLNELLEQGEISPEAYAEYSTTAAAALSASLESRGTRTTRTKARHSMPMIDVYATEGTFSDKHTLAQDLARAVMRWEQVPEIPLFLDNTAAFIHDLRADSISNAAGESNYVRVQILTPLNVLDRDKQLGVVKELTEIVVTAAGDPSLADRTWVLITESPEGGWGIDGHANTGADIVAAARAALQAEG